jgi:hypothetical protein
VTQAKQGMQSRGQHGPGGQGKARFCVILWVVLYVQVLCCAAGGWRASQCAVTAILHLCCLLVLLGACKPAQTKVSLPSGQVRYATAVLSSGACRRRLRPLLAGPMALSVSPTAQKQRKQSRWGTRRAGDLLAGQNRAQHRQ